LSVQSGRAMRSVRPKWLQLRCPLMSEGCTKTLNNSKDKCTDGEDSELHLRERMVQHCWDVHNKWFEADDDVFVVEGGDYQEDGDSDDKCRGRERSRSNPRSVIGLKRNRDASTSSGSRTVAALPSHPLPVQLDLVDMTTQKLLELRAATEAVLKQRGVS